jgi:hypothetical protein
MRSIVLVTAIAIAAGASFWAQGGQAAPINATRIDNATPLVLVQDKKPETTTQKVKRKVKRAWKDLTGYKFTVSCPFSKTTCTETGKDREEARGKCMSAHPLCAVNDAK